MEGLSSACALILKVFQNFFVRGVPCHLNIDLFADVHPRSQSEVHAVGTVDELLKCLYCGSLADFPDAKSRTFRADRTERVVVKTRF